MSIARTRYSPTARRAPATRGGTAAAATTASTVTYLLPIVAVILGAIVGEPNTGTFS